MSNQHSGSKQGDKSRRMVRPEDEDRRTDRSASTVTPKKRSGEHDNQSASTQTEESGVEDLPSGPAARAEAAKAKDD
jgi:hypothetical protein